MKRAALILSAVCIFSTTAFAEQVTNDLQLLREEIRAFASDELLRDLQDPTLLPGDGRHQGEVFWDTTLTDIPGGSLALIIPPAVRVGRELLVLRDLDVPFSDTFTVRRLLNAAESWNARGIASTTEALKIAEARVREAARNDNIQPDSNLARSIVDADPELISKLSADELIRSGSTAEGPDPGELYCYRLYKFVGHDTPDNTPCKGAGSSCWIRSCCRPPCGWGGAPLPRVHDAQVITN